MTDSFGLDSGATTEMGAVLSGSDVEEQEGHFKPMGTVFFLALFVVVLVLMWASVFLILMDRGVTV